LVKQQDVTFLYYLSILNWDGLVSKVTTKWTAFNLQQGQWRLSPYLYIWNAYETNLEATWEGPEVAFYPGINVVSDKNDHAPSFYLRSDHLGPAKFIMKTG